MMTEQQTLELIEEIRPNIEMLSCIFVGKMKQPPTCRMEDLYQEGIHAVLQNISLERHEKSKGASAKTFFTRVVLCRFIDLMRKSYKVPTPVSGDYFEASSGVISIPLEIEELLSPLERKYANCMIFPPKEIRGEILKNRKATRRLVREYLGISRGQEVEIRTSIRNKLTGEKE